MSLNIEEFTPMLEEYYTPERVNFLGYKDHPTMRMIKKVTNWTGSKYIQPVHFHSSQAIAHVFSTMNAVEHQGGYERFEVERAKLYGKAKLERLAMKASAGKGARAFLQAYTTEVDGVLGQLGTDISRNLFQGRNRALGVAGSLNVAGNVVTLSQREDVVSFEVGMGIVVSSDGTGANLVGAPTVRYISAIDRSAGALTFVDVRGGSTLATALDDASVWGTTFGNGATAFTLHREGTITAADDTLGLAGFSEWIPATAPGGSDDHFGVNRSVDADRLAGLRIDGTGFSTEDALIEACVRLREANKTPDYAVMNPQRIGYLIREAGSKVVHAPDASKKLGTRTIGLYTPSGEVKVYGDASCPINDCYVLTSKTWKMVSTGTFPEIFSEDLRMLRDSDADAYEVRMGGYGNLSCSDPGANARISF
jgi:hypothetical protein